MRSFVLRVSRFRFWVRNSGFRVTSLGFRACKPETQNSSTVLPLLRLNALDIHMNVDVVADNQSSGIESFVPYHTEILAI